jgi:arsenite methyltransferase
MRDAVVQQLGLADLRRRDAVRDAYSAAARDPGASHPFALGRALAEGVGYPPELLDRVPDVAVRAFSGVAAVGVDGAVAPGDRVLDAGCGAGLDTLVAARRTGGGGQVVGVDFSSDMLQRALEATRGSAEGADVAGVFLARAAAERLPLADGSVDVALVNGIFNLNPARAAIFAELARVVRPGGRVHAAELILCEPLADEDRTEAGWFA